MKGKKILRSIYPSQQERKKQTCCKTFLSCLHHHKIQINRNITFHHLPSFLWMKLFISWQLLVLRSSFSFKWGYNTKWMVGTMLRRIFKDIQWECQVLGEKSQKSSRRQFDRHISSFSATARPFMKMKKPKLFWLPYHHPTSNKLDLTDEVLVVFSSFYI